MKSILLCLCLFACSAAPSPEAQSLASAAALGCDVLHGANPVALAELYRVPTDTIRLLQTACVVASSGVAGGSSVGH